MKEKTLLVGMGHYRDLLCSSGETTHLRQQTVKYYRTYNMANVPSYMLLVHFLSCLLFLRPHEKKS